MRNGSLSPVGHLLREWRTARGKSQLALATHAGVSSRHLSFIETGRSTPSREMVLLLSDALDVPLRERNALLEAAGYAAVFRETPLEAPEMEQVRALLEALLRGHGKNPAVVVNRRCDILMSNDAALRLVRYLVPSAGLARGVATNVVRLIFSPDGARPCIENWDEVASEIVWRVRRESLREDDSVLREVVGPEIDLPSNVPALTRMSVMRTPSIMLPIRIRRGDVHMNLCSTLTTLGSPLDVTLQELRLESLFAADAKSERELMAIVNPTPAAEAEPRR